jgi:hypothetical protein
MALNMRALSGAGISIFEMADSGDEAGTGEGLGEGKYAEDVDGRDKPGHDGRESEAIAACTRRKKDSDSEIPDHAMRLRHMRSGMTEWERPG